MKSQNVASLLAEELRGKCCVLRINREDIPNHVEIREGIVVRVNFTEGSESELFITQQFHGDLRSTLLKKNVEIKVLDEIPSYYTINRVKPLKSKKMNNNAVTQKEVDENMQDYHTMTLTSFGKRVTFVEVRMKNGFTLRETECPVDDSNYDEKVGEKMCLEKIEQKVWTLLGYALKEKLSK